jgi:hypothetical protein
VGDDLTIFTAGVKFIGGKCTTLSGVAGATGGDEWIFGLMDYWMGGKPVRVFCPFIHKSRNPSVRSVGCCFWRTNMVYFRHKIYAYQN